MGVWTIFIVAVSLSMDALAVSIANGIALGAAGRRRLAAALAMAAAFGLFQGLMPLIGYYAAAIIGGDILRRFSGWVAFVLLALIGGKMIWETLKADGGGEAAAFRLTLRLLLAQAVATSIDALAVGVTLAAEGARIGLAAPLIAATTFVIVFFGAIFGGDAGRRLEKHAGVVGGAVLVLIGVKSLVQSLIGGP